MKLEFLALAAAAGLVGCPAPCVAQRPDSVPGAAILFAYRPDRGQAEQFHEGYRRHLDWHRSSGDTLVWYGWEILTGPRAGLFIDGTFGRPFLAIDRRVDPGGDEADLRTNIGGLSQLVAREAYRLRPEFGTAAPLESRQPTPVIEVVTYLVRPGMEIVFEELLAKTRLQLPRDSVAPMVTWYELVNGGAHATYLLVVHRRGLSGWDTRRMDLSSQILRLTGDRQRLALQSELAKSVSFISSESWRFLPASSYIPRQDIR